MGAKALAKEVFKRLPADAWEFYQATESGTPTVQSPHNFARALMDIEGSEVAVYISFPPLIWKVQVNIGDVIIGSWWPMWGTWPRGIRKLDRKVTELLDVLEARSSGRAPTTGRLSVVERE